MTAKKPYFFDTLDRNLFAISLVWKLRKHLFRIFGHKEDKVWPPLIRGAARAISVTTGAVLLIILSSLAVENAAAPAAFAISITSGLVFLYNLDKLRQYIFFPTQTSSESRELHLLGRRLRRGAYRLVSSAVEILGVSPERASGYRIINEMMNGRMMTSLLAEAVVRLDLLAMLTCVISLLASLVVFFGCLYWQAIPIPLSLREPLILALQTLSTAELSTLGPRTCRAVQTISCIQVILQVILLVVLIPMLVNLYERDKAMNQEMAMRAPELRRAIRPLIWEHETRFLNRSANRDATQAAGDGRTPQGSTSEEPVSRTGSDPNDPV